MGFVEFVTDLGHVSGVLHVFGGSSMTNSAKSDEI